MGEQKKPAKKGRRFLTERERIASMVRCVQLFYVRDPSLPQAQIAKHLGLGPSTVSRLLREARDAGIVKIEVCPPRDPELAVDLRERYGLQDAIVVGGRGVVDTQPNPDEPHLDGQPGVDLGFAETLGKAASDFLVEPDSPLRKARKVGLSCGDTLREMLMALPKGEFKNLDLYTLTIEGLPDILDQAPSTLVGLFLAKCKEGSKAFCPLSIPYLGKTKAEKESHEESEEERLLRVRKQELRRELFEDQSKELENHARELDLAIIGIGAVDPRNKTLGYTKILDCAGVSAKEVSDANIVGEICNRPFDLNGTDKFGALLGLTNTINALPLSLMQELASRKPVIAIAGGEKKINAIHVALKHKFANILVTDSTTAEKLLALP